MAMQSNSATVVGDDSLQAFNAELASDPKVRGVRVQKVGKSNDAENPGGIYFVTWLEEDN